ncbi:hypothetical protein GCM10010350_44090 [Streptomyces galilaeus]|nr:hypothetical protein GCM10010350_44090 [Streptomyces galilaeus]
MEQVTAATGTASGRVCAEGGGCTVPATSAAPAAAVTGHNSRCGALERGRGGTGLPIWGVILPQARHTTRDSTARVVRRVINLSHVSMPWEQTFAGEIGGTRTGTCRTGRHGGEFPSRIHGYGHMDS